MLNTIKLNRVATAAILLAGLIVNQVSHAEIFLYENTNTNNSFYGSYKFDSVNYRIFDVSVYFGHDTTPGITTFSDEHFRNIGIVEPHSEGFRIIFRDTVGSLTGTAIFTGDPNQPEVTYKTNMVNFNAGIERAFGSNNGGTFIRKKLD